MAVKTKSTKSPGNPKLLYRSETERVIAGVAGGIGEYLELDATLIRLAFVLITLAGGSGILIYLILWLIIPSRKNVNKKGEDSVKENAAEMRDRANEFSQNLKADTRGGGKMLIGFLLLGLGFIFLLENFNIFPFIDFARLWPLILVILGLAILSR